MPLVAHNDLPTFQVLKDRGQTVLSVNRANEQDIRELHIGFLNMMPDAALAATERQFIRMVGSSNPIAQFYVYPFTIPELARSDAAMRHIDKYYSQFDDLARDGLDALIITGANVTDPSLDKEPFWDPLIEVVKWAEKNVASVFCSCLATHALVKHYHGLDRVHLDQKQWGVYSHKVTNPSHPLLRDVNTRFDAPHSRYNDISREQFESADCHVLAESPGVGVHLAVGPDQFRTVYFQGHPEYAAISLLKECKREVNRYIAGERDSRPRVPENYFTAEGQAAADAHIDAVVQAVTDGTEPPEFPESELLQYADNTWGDTGKAIVNNWLGLVYQLTNLDRHKQFMPGVDADNPLEV